MYIIQFTVYTLSTLFRLHYSVECTLECTLYIAVFSEHYSVQCTLQCTVYITVYSVHYSVHIWPRFCGSKLPHPLIATESSMLLVFKSDASVQRKVRHTIHCTLYTVHCTVHCTLYTIQYTLHCNIHCTCSANVEWKSRGREILQTLGFPNRRSQP